LGLREAKDGLSIYVKDTGEGMDAEELESIFSEFVKLERHDEQAVRGVGLGLSISERLSGLLGCQLKVASVKGEGTEFQLLIPRVMIAGEVAGEVEVAENKPVQTYNWEGRSILIVEDEQSNFEYLQEALRGTNIQIDCVKNGSEAVKRIEDASNSYDLVLMDISMPVMDGVASLKEIRRIKPELKVIAQTAHAMAEDRAKYKEAGFDDYLSKPILRDRLYASIAQFI
jgi:two-component system CheB/CheR fusion protein